MGFCPMKIVFDGIALLGGGALPAFVFSVMPCSLPSYCKLAELKMTTPKNFKLPTDRSLPGINVKGTANGSNLSRVQVSAYSDVTR